MYYIYFILIGVFGSIIASETPDKRVFPAIEDIKKGDYKVAPTCTLSTVVGTPNLIPLVIIGSGPAGLSAALYGARSALHTVVFEGEKPGGQLTDTSYVENFPAISKISGCDLVDQIGKQACAYGAVCVKESIASVDFSQWPFSLKTHGGDTVHALAVVIATGASPRFLNDSRVVPGEHTYMGQGVSTCAVCDAPLYKDQHVAVVGGGDSAVEEALYLASYARSITMLVRGPSLRASQVMQERLKKIDSIKVLYNVTVEEIGGNGTNVTEVIIKDTQKGELSTLPLDGVFIAIGHLPSTTLFTQWNLTDDQGHIIVGPYSQQTRIPGVFAAGDVCDKKYRQAGVAAGDGIKAALDAYAFLQNCGYSHLFARQLKPFYYTPLSE